MAEPLPLLIPVSSSLEGSASDWFCFSSISSIFTAGQCRWSESTSSAKYHVSASSRDSMSICSDTIAIIRRV